MSFFKQRLKSFKHAFTGLWLLLKNEPNGRIHGIALLLITLLGFVFNISSNEWMLVLLCFALVISMELINSALESLADAVTQEEHPHIKKAKDLAAAAVLWSAIISAIIGCLIFIPKALYLLN